MPRPRETIGSLRPTAATSLCHSQCHPCAGIIGLDGDEPLQQLQRLLGVLLLTECHPQIVEGRNVVGIPLQGKPQDGDALVGVPLLQIGRTLLCQGFGFVRFLPTDEHPVVGDSNLSGPTLPYELPGQMLANRLEVVVSLKLTLILGQLLTVEIREWKLNVVGSVRHQSVM